MSQTRKLITIVTEAALEQRVAQDVLRLGAHGYTVIDARGSGAHGKRDAALDQFGNIKIDVICEEKVAARIAEHMRAQYFKHYAMILYVSEVEVLRSEKF